MPEESEAKVEAPVFPQHPEQEADSRVHTPGEEGSSVSGGRSEHGTEAESEGKPVSDMVPFEREGEPYPIVRYKGKEFYAITRYGNGSKKPYTEYREIGAPLSGNGTMVPITRDSATELNELRVSELRKRKDDRRKAYEESVVGALDDVANLQLSILRAASDPHSDLTYDDIAKAKLGLQAAEAILNRALGKPVTKIDADVTTNVNDEMMEMVDGWVIEEEG